MNNEELAQLFTLLDRIATALEAQPTEDDEIETSPLNDLRRLAFEAVAKAFDDAMKIVLSYRRATQMLLGKKSR